MGHPVTIFMPNWMSAERINLIRSLGAEIVPVSKEEGGFLGSIAKAEDPTLHTSYFCPRTDRESERQRPLENAQSAFSRKRTHVSNRDFISRECAKRILT